MSRRSNSLKKAKLNRLLLAFGAAVLLVLPMGLAVRGEEAEGIDDAAFVFQFVPSSMTAGGTHVVSVTMTNTGTSTWTRGSGYQLGSQSPADNTTWGLNRVPVPTGKAVSPGKSITFRFSVVAPSVSGIYGFQWQMLRQTHDLGAVYFGAMTTHYSVNVTGGTGGINNAQFVSQSIPTSMVTGQVANVEVRMRNNGSSTWSSGSGYALASQNPPNNSTWGLNRAALPTAVQPGQEITFNFAVTAPAAIGIYNCQWEMIQEGVDFFGEVTPNVAVNVTSGVGTNDASFVSQVVPAAATTGQVFAVTLILQNTGSTTWSTASGYRLGSQNPQDNTTWGPNRIALPGDVAPGATASFAFNVTAPTTAATYNFQWRMVQEGVGFFGAQTANVAIVVTASGTGDEGFGNNLAVPVVFAESHGMTGLLLSEDSGLRPRPEEVVPSMPYFDPAHTFMLNGVVHYPQATPSTWQAQYAAGSPEGEHVVINWSDNLLNTKWTPKSVVRVENTLYADRLDTMNAYTMHFLTGEGTTESWGTDASTYASTYRTVYSNTARLKIEKISRPGGEVIPNAASFNGAVYEKYGVDGPGGYSAEVNVSGNLIYGYNWKLNSMPGTQNDKLGWWRLTFTLDSMASYLIDGQLFYVPCNTQMDALDPIDLAGRYFKPTLVSSSTSVLEIEIVRSRQGTN